MLQVADFVLAGIVMGLFCEQLFAKRNYVKQLHVQSQYKGQYINIKYFRRKLNYILQGPKYTFVRT